MKTFNISVEAGDPKQGMTLGELYGLVREAMAAGMPLETVVDIRNGWRGQLRQASVIGPVEDTARTVDLDGPELRP